MWTLTGNISVAIGKQFLKLWFAQHLKGCRGSCYRMKQETSTDCAIGTAIQIPHTFIKATIRHAVGIAASISHCLTASTAGNWKNCTATMWIGNLISESKTGLLVCLCKYKRKKESGYMPFPNSYNKAEFGNCSFSKAEENTYNKFFLVILWLLKCLQFL